MSKSSPNPNSSPSMFQTDFPSSEFSARRQDVFDRIGSNAVAVLQGASPRGELELFRQSNEFYYLCGIEVPYAYLLLDARSRKTILYLPKRNIDQERSEGPILNADDTDLAEKLTGVDEVRRTEEFSADIADAETVYVPQGSESEKHHNPLDLLNTHPTRETRFIQRLKDFCPQVKLQDLSPIIFSLRTLKSPNEIKLMQCAGQLTGLAVTESMRCTKPGIMEFQLRSVADFIFLANGAKGGGYPAIIAGGANAWYGHYFRNNCELQDGDLVLMDYAPDYGYYTSDIGRMWPINGEYTAWQRELYGFIVEYHKTLLKLIRPDVLASQIMDEAAITMEDLINRTNFSKDYYEKAARKALEFRGHLSHTVGMDVHDRGDYRSQPLVTGTVFSVDPMMWIPEEKLYIRVEDTVIVTENGMENLTQLAPLELDDVEIVMKEKGILENHHLIKYFE